MRYLQPKAATGPLVSQNLLKTYLKKSLSCLIWYKSGSIWAQIWHPWVRSGLESFAEIENSVTNILCSRGKKHWIHFILRLNVAILSWERKTFCYILSLSGQRETTHEIFCFILFFYSMNKYFSEFLHVLAICL